MKLEKGNVVKILDDSAKIAYYKGLGFMEAEEKPAKNKETKGKNKETKAENNKQTVNIAEENIVSGSEKSI